MFVIRERLYAHPVYPSDRNKMQFKDKKLTKNALIFSAHENTVFPMDRAAEEINVQITLIVRFFF